MPQQQKSSKSLISLQKSTALSIPNEKIFYCIRISFLQQKNFKLAYQNGLKINKTYDQYSQNILSFFKTFNQYCSHLIEKKPKNDQKILFLDLFRQYLYDNAKITTKITEYQISCFQSIKQNKNDEEISMALHLVIQNAKKYSPIQKQIRDKKQVLTQQFTNIKSQYASLLHKMKKPKYLYDKNYLRQQFLPIKSKIQQHQKCQQKILNEIIKVNENAHSFQSQIAYFRKQMLQNKYKYRKKLIELATNSKQSLIQLFFYQYNCLNDYIGRIKQAMQKHDDQFSLLKAQKTQIALRSSQPSECMNMVIKNTQSYISLLESIQKDMRATQKHFGILRDKLKQYEQKDKNLKSYSHLNSLFEIDQSPTHLMLDTINAFQFCFKRISDKQIDCKKAADSIENIRKQVIKHKGITISLLKVKMNSSINDKSLSISNKTISQECGVYKFMNQLDIKPVKQVIKRCLQQILVTFSSILDYFNHKQSSNRKVPILDSMELSYQQQSVLNEVKKKKPLKQQLWLWQDHKKKIDTQFLLSTQLFAEVNSTFESLKDESQFNLDIEKYSCYCMGFQESGQLCLSKKQIKFISKASSRELCIPISDIDEIRRKTLMVIQDSVFLVTKYGELEFNQFQNSQRVQIALKELIEGGGNPTSKIKGKQKVELTEQERAKITARRADAEKERVKIDQFQSIMERKFQGIRIDEFYDLILSDKKFNLTGKQHDSFMVYVMKKLNNKDFKITQFTPPGPKYYTMNQEVTFENSPISSQCNYEYYHILNIPFLPSECLNKQTRKVFWLSDKELDYFIYAQTYGVPMSETFHVELVYRITEEEQDVRLKVYAQVKFSKSFALKSTIQSSSWKQIKQGTKNTIDQMEKGIKIYKSLLKGQAVQKQQQPEQADPKKQMQSLKKRNLYMTIVIVVIILLNILYKIFY